MRLQKAVTQAYESVFESALEDPHRLVALHRRVQEGRGRRSEELTSLNRAIVVVAIAAWQAYVEALTNAILDALGPPADSTTSGTTMKVVWEGRRSEVQNMIDRYSTANSTNTLSLFRSVSFDPESAWTWGVGAGLVKSGQAKSRLDRWVKIRHSIAHGSALPRTAKGLITENKTSGLTIRLKDAVSCLDFIERLAAATNDEAVALASRIDSADSQVAFEEARIRSAQSAIARHL